MLLHFYKVDYRTGKLYNRVHSYTCDDEPCILPCRIVYHTVQLDKHKYHAHNNKHHTRKPHYIYFRYYLYALVQLFLIRYSHITHHGKQTVIHAQYHKPYRAVEQTENAVVCGIGDIQRQRACGVQHYSETLALREQADKFFQPESVFFQFIRPP